MLQSRLVNESGTSTRWVKTVICGLAVALAPSLITSTRASGKLDSSQKSVPTDGARIYADNCVECHAADGHGLMLHQPNFTDPDWQAAVTDQELSRVIKWGREPMPFWVGALTDEQIASVVKFIRTMGRPRAGSVFREPVKTAPNQQAAEAQKPGASTLTQSDTCAGCHKTQDAKLLLLHTQSAHAKAGKSCNSCHGGDASATAKQDAHALNFVGKPNSDQAVRMCGSCHRSEAAQYRASHHFPVQKAVSRVDCVECHGAHTVGAPARSYSLAYFCSGCHGLEYLPGLQQQFQDMLKLSDDLRVALLDLTQAGHPPSDEILKRRKEIQILTAEIVHNTDLEGGTAKIPHILELGEKLKSMIGSSGKGNQ